MLVPSSGWRALALALLLGLGLAGCDDPASRPIVGIENRLPDLQFSLQAAGGRTVTQNDVRGHIALVFFGYANCPDVCPATMARLAQLTDDLGDDADEIRVLFISVDPHRDTPEMLERYVSAFQNPSAIGLSGSAAETERLARRYRVSFQILEPANPGDSNYVVNHSKGVFVFDRQGEVSLLVPDIDAPGAAAALTAAVRSQIDASRAG
ncbi:MAG: SCO family protein [Pigmentiphaga sp.]